jgi:hypothetical protein
MENSKLYQKLGKKLGYKEIKYTQRGIIAKMTLKYIDKLELQNFSNKLKRIYFN